MKSTKILYWVFTGLICLLMLFSSIPSVVPGPEAIAFFQSMGFPAYMISFLSVAKILGVIGILVPGFPRVREWAYAGLAFDLIGALYAQVMVGAESGGLVFMVASVAVLFASYYYAHKKDRGPAGATAPSAVA